CARRHYGSSYVRYFDVW
nr:immunoglobulin heavy chain junction region [Mus musculus]MBK4185607.1 immunoglobulin heavy chain junction region [Mus musculus]MBK4185609.1 immunoglobulin heavy chain junction region [Mus musculus]MBK4185610.1 immunoglobulin heavy chain junction region [Mus musculus]MBK4185611.1 immunoglobulin heavy chain junction region [Mus musculus]